MFDLNVYNTLDPKKGRLLITEPFMQNDYFHRSVILLCEHNEDGSFGFVLNNYTDVKLSEFENMHEVEGFCDDFRISIGGPVSAKNLYYIHTLGDQLPDSIHVAGNIYAGGDFDLLKEKIANGQVTADQVRFFLGYSGWVEKQLNGELKQNSWLEQILITQMISWMSTMRQFGKTICNVREASIKYLPTFLRILH